MSELIYLKRQNKITGITTRTSLPDHKGCTYEDLALRGYLFSTNRQHTVPCSRKFAEFLEEHDFIPSPEKLMIVAADDDERRKHPFTTSYFWITWSNGGYGRKSISKEEAIEILRDEEDDSDESQKELMDNLKKLIRYYKSY